MKRYGYLWDDFVSWENLLLAAKKARRGKRHRYVVSRFDFNLESNLLNLQHELNSGNYRPGNFTTHWIHQPKKRLISAAPYRDRVVHHALLNILEPILDRHFYNHSYACRKGKGTHAAMKYLQRLMRKNKYAVKCDIVKFFPSIDHEILKSLFVKRIKDRKLLVLMNLFVDSSNKQENIIEYYPEDHLFTPFERSIGIPIGNLTSQWFANWYLDQLDHYLTSNLGVGGYVRYCDDFIILDNDKSKLKQTLQTTKELLNSCRLKLHEDKLQIHKTNKPLNFVGYRVSPISIKLPQQNIRRFNNRLKWLKQEYSVGNIENNDLKSRINSWLGHAKQADTYGLLDKLSANWSFSRVSSV